MRNCKGGAPLSGRIRRATRAATAGCSSNTCAKRTKAAILIFWKRVSAPPPASRRFIECQGPAARPRESEDLSFLSWACTHKSRLLTMSALPPKATKQYTSRHVRFVPKADIILWRVDLPPGCFSQDKLGVDL